MISWLFFFVRLLYVCMRIYAWSVCKGTGSLQQLTTALKICGKVETSFKKKDLATSAYHVDHFLYRPQRCYT